MLLAPLFGIDGCRLQHDLALLPAMLASLKEGGTDIMIGIRYVDGGSLGHWNQSRAIISRIETRRSR